MNGTLSKLVFVATAVVLGIGTLHGATLEVSQPVQVTSNAYYERGQSIVYDGSDYWLFYGRSTTVTGNYGNSNPDTHDYEVYYKKASSVTGLASATASKVIGTNNANGYLGETGATVLGGDVWAFATPDMGATCEIYGWWTNDGGMSWNEVGPIVTGLSTGQAHHDEIAFGGKLWVLEGSGNFTTTYSATPKTGGWSTPLTVGSLTGGLAHFFIDGSDLYLAIYSAGSNYIYEYQASPEQWNLVASAVTGGYDPTLLKVGSDYTFAQAPWTGGRQWVLQWAASTLDANFFTGSTHMVVEGQYGSNVWVDMWPIGFTDNGGTHYLLYTSERDLPSAEGTGNIWHLEIDWDLSRDHYTYVQEAIDGATSGDVINVAAGTYAERPNVDKSLELRGAQYAVDPTQGGARTSPTDESTITEAGLSDPNPNVLVEIPNGVTNVVIDGFTLNGDPTDPTADTSTLRVWDDDITISNNIIDGRFGALLKGSDNLTVDQNRITANKIGVAVQPNPATSVTISDNAITLGSSPAGDESAMYLTSTSNSAISGNTATGFINGKGAGGSNLTNVDVTDNTFTGNKDAVSFWGSTTFITIDNNDLSGSIRYGISIKGQDIDITNNVLTGCGDTGVNVDRHVIDTERVTIHDNDLSGNTNFGVQVNTALVTEDVNASGNWWGTNTPTGVAAEVTAKVDYTPWLDVGTDTGGDPGFEGDFSTLHVDDDSPQTGTTGRIQEGTEMVTASTVNILPGTYPTSLVFAAGFNTNNLTISGDVATRPILTGGVRFLNTADISDLTIENLVIRGVASGGNGIFDMDQNGDVTNFTMNNCVIDGEDVSSRHGFLGQDLDGDIVFTDCEFMGVRGWSLLDLNSGSGDGGADLPISSVMFTGNDIHDCGGAISLRGHLTDRTDLVVVSDNAWDNINEPGEHAWAAVEINSADVLQAYDNSINDVAENSWGEGQAIQLWNIVSVDIHDNTITNNFMGIFVYGGGMYAAPGGSIYDNTMTGNSEFAVQLDATATGGTVDATCNWWGSADGPNVPPGNPTGNDDVEGDVTYAPWLGAAPPATCDEYGDNTVSADASEACISTEHPCEVVPVVFTRADVTDARGASVTIQLSPELELCGSITQGSWLDGFSTNYFVNDNGGGSYTIDQAIQGLPCGVTTGGTLFDIPVQKAASVTSDDTGTITVTSVTIRDCSNVPLPGIPGAPADIPIDITAPAAVTDLAAAQVKTGNDADGTTMITLTFTAPGDGAIVNVFRKGYGDYPEYDDGTGVVPTAPTDSADAVAGGWTLTPVTASGQTDEPSTRDYWYYVVFTRDGCSNQSAVSNMTGGTLNYHLGDVSDGVTAGAGDNLVNTADMSLLGANYWATLVHGDPVNYLDVGPTSDYTVDGLPTTDNQVQFEDLMMFSINYLQVGVNPQDLPELDAAEMPELVLALSDRSLQANETITAWLRLENNEAVVKGVHAKVGYDSHRLELMNVAMGDLLDDQGEQMFFASLEETDGVIVDAAAMGAGVTIIGTGDVAELTFRIRDNGAVPTLTEVALRDAANTTVSDTPGEWDGEETTDVAIGEIPVQLRLVGASPNPFTAGTAIAFELPEALPVTITIFDVNGRLVRTLARRGYAAGRHSVGWDATASNGSRVAAGVYFYSFRAGTHGETRKLLLYQ